MALIFEGSRKDFASADWKAKHGRRWCVEVGRDGLQDGRTEKKKQKDRVWNLGNGWNW